MFFLEQFPAIRCIFFSLQKGSQKKDAAAIRAMGSRLSFRLV
ncbi:hypothetical protein HJ01_02023 [Flavobacterium frigoris PS1]|uniref:Uncharacterized protein n=1 Tax=Flavobacterium frigoris (strain PS1) TaxID=1086011 RepID=H7FSM5_FLAFP|nr:hypothetical protein HJ01_02023 [Flavobacterium frigoris PS1]